MANKYSPSLLEKAKSGRSPLAQTPTKGQLFKSKHDVQPPVALVEQSVIDEASASPEEIFPTAKLNLAQPPPLDVAILHVYADGDNVYKVWGGHIDDCLEPGKPKAPPALSLAEMMQPSIQEGMELPHRIKEYMHEFSRPHSKLRQWINQLREAYGEDLKLLIVDHTDFEIPWEVFKLSQGQDYLGALVTTSRWSHVVPWDMETLLLEFEEEECQGHVVSFVDQAELEGVGPELEVLGELNAWNANDIRTFRKRLIQKLAGVGLVYVASHGIWGKRMHDMALGSLHDKKQRIRLMELYEVELCLFKSSRSIVFINACHSGRLRSEDYRLRDGLRRGFAELFLSQGARGVIGTLAAVNDQKAALLAREFMLAVQQYPHFSVAAILRWLRMRAIVNLPEEPEDKDLLDFVYTFVYVYYGSPRTRLRLIKREEEAYD